MKKRILLALSVLSAMAAGTVSTFALFSASQSSRSTFTSARLCLDSARDDRDSVPGPMFYVTADEGRTTEPPFVPGQHPTGLWAPGDQHTRTLTVMNPRSCSSLAAWLESVQASLEPGSYAPMAGKLWVEILTPSSGPDEKVAEGWLSDFLAGPVPLRYADNSKPFVGVNGNRHFKFRVTFDRSADNSYQGQSLVVHFTVNGVQAQNNP
jgi:hypothetical protein